MNHRHMQSISQSVSQSINQSIKNTFRGSTKCRNFFEFINGVIWGLCLQRARSQSFLPCTGALESPASLASLGSEVQATTCGLSSLEGSPDLSHPEGPCSILCVFPSETLCWGKREGVKMRGGGLDSFSVPFKAEDTQYGPQLPSPSSSRLPIPVLVSKHY